MNQGYLSDEELKRLIEDVEDNKMMQAPRYLKQQVLETLDADETRIRTKKQHRKLVVFEMKIAGGLAAAMLMLFLIPITAQGEQSGETSVKEPTVMEVKTQEFFRACRQISDRMVEGISEASDRMLNPWLDQSTESSEETESVKEPGQSVKQSE